MFSYRIGLGLGSMLYWPKGKKLMSTRKIAMTKLGKIRDMNRDFDLQYWQCQSPTARMVAVWEMTVFHHKLKKCNPHELRLDRTAGGLRPREY